jgi:hypothetical protein
VADRWLVAKVSESAAWVWIRDRARESEETIRYRILTTDGQILGQRASKKEAVALALQQARQLRESIEIKKLNADGEYEPLTTVLNPDKFVTQEQDDITLPGQRK